MVILMLGCSYAFINPAGYQTSLMVMKPGGYKFVDFVRVGVPLTVVVGAVASAVVGSAASGTGPASASITSATRRLTPGIVSNNATAVFQVKGSSAPSVT